MSDYCGDGDIKLVLIDGDGSDPWRKTTRAMYENEAAKCRNVTSADYFDAQGDVQKYNTAFTTFSAQGYDAILTFDDFGSGGLGALRGAFRDGIAVVAYASPPGGTVGEDYTAFVGADKTGVGRGWGEWLNTELDGSGSVIEFGGPAGNPASETWMASLKEGLEPYPGITLADSNPIVTNWAIADTQKAASGAASRYPDLDAIALEYGQTLNAVFRAYESAGKAAPLVVATSSTNGTACDFAAYRVTHPDFQLLSYDGLGNTVLTATRKAVAAAQGIGNTEPDTVPMSVWFDSAANVIPECDPTLPPGADLSTTLTLDQLKALFR